MPNLRRREPVTQKGFSMASAGSREPESRITVPDAGYRRRDDPLGGLAAILAEHGMVAVPVKPTMKQIVAGMSAAGVTVDEAWRVYSAILDAANS